MEPNYQSEVTLAECCSKYEHNLVPGAAQIGQQQQHTRERVMEELRTL